MAKMVEINFRPDERTLFGPTVLPIDLSHVRRHESPGTARHGQLDLFIGHGDNATAAFMTAGVNDCDDRSSD